MRNIKWNHPMEDVILGDSETHRTSGGLPRTTSLFLEMTENMNWEPVYTLKRKDQGKYKSMHKMFMEDKDPTGYTTCMRTVGAFVMWRKIWANAFLAPIMEDWIIELEAALTAEAIKKMRALDNPTAAKWLADKGWEKKRGRPSKAEKAKATKAATQTRTDLANDAARIKLVKNG